MILARVGVKGEDGGASQSRLYKTTCSSMFFHVLSTAYRILEKSVEKHQKVQWLACMKPRTCGGEFGRRGAILGLVRVTLDKT